MIKELLQEESEFNLKEKSISLLTSIIKVRPLSAEFRVKDILEAIAIGYQLNKKLVGNLEELLIELDNNIDKAKLF